MVDGRRSWTAAMSALVVLGLGTTAAIGCSGDDSGDGSGASGDADSEGSSAEAAPSGLVQVLGHDDIEVELEPLTGAVGTETVRLALVGSGEVDEIGRGRAARQPAEGERFVVVAVEKQAVPIADTVIRPEQAEMTERGTATFGVQVGEAAPSTVNLDVPSYTPLPIDLDDPPQPPPAGDAAAPQRRLLVVSAPKDAAAIDLVVTSSGLDQRLSLLTGEPGDANAAVLARANRTMAAPATAQEVSLTSTEFGMTASTTQPINVGGASLQWSSGSGPGKRMAEPGRAVLQVLMDTGGIHYGLATELALPDGTVVQPLPAADEMLASALPFVEYDVPAGFTTGTLVLGKDYTWEVPTGGGNFVVDFAGPVEFPIEIPADDAA